MNGKRTFEVGQGELATADPRRLQRRDAGPAGQLAAAHHRPGPAVRGAADPERADARPRRARSAPPSCSTCAPARCSPRPATRPTTRPTGTSPSRPTASDAATSFVVDPGSIHKAIVFGAGLQEGVIKPDTHVHGRDDDRARATPRSPTRTRANGRRMTLPGVLAYSSNVGTIHDRRPARRAEAVRVPASSSGSGKPTGEGLPGEAAGPGAAARRLERLVARLDPDRPRRRRDAAADGRRVRGDRQRRHLGAAAPGQGDDRAGRPATPAAPRRRPGR